MTSGERSASVKCRQVWRKVREMLAGNQFVDIAQVQCNFCGSRSSCGNWWHTVTHGRGSEGWNWWMEWVASTLTPPPNVVYPALLKLMRTHRLPAVDWTDAPHRFKWTRPFRGKTKSGFCACAIRFRTSYTSSGIARVGRVVRPPWAAECKRRKKMGAAK